MNVNRRRKPPRGRNPRTRPSPDFEQELRRLDPGWRYVETSGGCDALQLDQAASGYWHLTIAGDCIVPTSLEDEVHVGSYDAQGEYSGEVFNGTMREFLQPLPSVLAELRRVDKRWSYETTGGGCDGFTLARPDGTQLLITIEEDCYAPSLMSEQIAVGTYNEDFSDLVGDVEYPGTVTEYIRALRPSSGNIAAALAKINRHRALIGERPLDQAAAGWTDEDVLLEARRIESNPRRRNPSDSVRERWLLDPTGGRR